MVVHQINIPSVACLKPEDQTPIARDGEAPEAAPIAPEWMQTPSGKHRHVCYRRGMGKGKEHPFDLRRHGGRHTPWDVLHKQALVLIMASATPFCSCTT